MVASKYKKVHLSRDSSLTTPSLQYHRLKLNAFHSSASAITTIAATFAARRSAKRRILSVRLYVRHTRGFYILTVTSFCV